MTPQDDHARRIEELEKRLLELSPLAPAVNNIIGPDGSGEGLSLPPGGSTNQVLAKASATNNDLKWKNDNDTIYSLPSNVLQFQTRTEVTFIATTETAENGLQYIPVTHNFGYTPLAFVFANNPSGDRGVWEPMQSLNGWGTYMTTVSFKATFGLSVSFVAGVNEAVVGIWRYWARDGNGSNTTNLPAVNCRANIYNVSI